MKTQKYIIRLSGEITVKSDPVRKKIIKLLRENIAKILTSFEYEFILTSSWDILELQVQGNFEKEMLEKRLQNIFGISYILSVNEYIFEKKEEILLLIEKYFGEKLRGKKFFVRVKRVGKHDFSSQDLERLIGGYILKNIPETSVSLKDADILVSLEIKDQKVFLIEKRLEGAGGYPTGFSGKVLSLISGGFDSTVSSYMAMKRGLEVDFLFFDLGFPPQTLGVSQVSYFLWKEYEKSYPAHFIKVDFSFLVGLLLEHATPKFRSVLLKRYMLKTTHVLNTYLQERYPFLKTPYQALVKGDSIAQVSSQTLVNLTQIDEATSLLVLRPLIMFDKQEIIDMSRRIGTYDFAHNMPEYCGVVSQNPSTKATKEEIEIQEAKIDELFFAEIFQKISLQKITDVLDQKSYKYTGEIVENFDEGVVIDIREPEKIQKSPLLKGNHEVLEIPFYTINHRFGDLDASKKYYLYCEKGTLSQLHAMYLQEKGFQNVSVVRFGRK